MIFQSIENNFLGFYLTNIFPRNLLTYFIGRLSLSDNPFIVKGLLFLFRIFSGDLNLTESKESNFKTFHEYFIRELKEGVRPVNHNNNTIISPVDSLVGAFGYITDGQLYQIKNEKYSLYDLLSRDKEMTDRFKDGTYFTLRIKPNFYHRFHMILDGTIHKVNFIPGELWNINNATLLTVKSLFTKNERAILYGKHTELDFAIIPVGTVLVGSIKLNFLSHSFNHSQKFPYSLGMNYNSKKGEELGMFHYGSTVLVLLSKKINISDSIQTSRFLKYGEPLGTF
jgi:phosphatidylserine decarboxylase